MAQTDVSSCVLSIVSSLKNGLEVFKKFREARIRRRLKSKKNAIHDEEVRLTRSLQRGSQDIGKEYRKRLKGVGHQHESFARGDGIAQASLARILLKLNSGLVNIINTFLSKRKDGGALDYRSLADLSESSRVETCQTLRELYQRLRGRSHMPLGMKHEPLQSWPSSKSGESHAGKQKHLGAAETKHAKVRGPMLARVVIADSSKSSVVAMVRPGGRKRSSSTTASSSKAQSSLSLTTPASPPSQPLKASSHASKVSPQHHAPRRKHSAPIKSEQLMVPSLPTLEQRPRKATPTFYSIETTSTKLGEIPLHRWREPYDFDAMSRLNREAEENGWPLADIELEQGEKKRAGLWRLFRKRAKA